MDLYILNKSLEIAGIIDVFTSLIWTKRYFSAGDFELHLPATKRNVNLLQSGNYIKRLDDDTVMIIEKIQITTDAETGNFLTISGRSLESLLARRIVWKQTVFIGAFNKFIEKLLNENVIAPIISNRKINNFVYDNTNSFTKRIPKMLTGDNLYTAIVEACTSYNIGWKITLNDNKQFVFSLYQGVDRSYNQSANSYVIFSPEYDNLINSDYQRDTTEFANVALIAGEGEGNARKTQTVSNGTPTGIDRFEIFVDAKNASSNTEEEISETEYNEILSEQGFEALNEKNIITAFGGELETTGVFKYKDDWNIGDTIQIENEYGLTATSQILEIIENEDTSGYRIIPTFGEWEVK